MTIDTDKFDVDAYIRRSVASPDWLKSVQLELRETTDPSRRQVLEDQLRRRREALVEYGSGKDE